MRPVIAQNWEIDETIGALLVENVEHGLYDSAGTVAGDIGADQHRAPAVLAYLATARELGE